MIYRGTDSASTQQSVRAVSERRIGRRARGSLSPLGLSQRFQTYLSAAQECLSRRVAEDTGSVASKYDLYWTGQLAEIRAAVARAASGVPSAVRLPGSLA